MRPGLPREGGVRQSRAVGRRAETLTAAIEAAYRELQQGGLEAAEREFARIEREAAAYRLPDVECHARFCLGEVQWQRYDIPAAANQERAELRGALVATSRGHLSKVDSVTAPKLVVLAGNSPKLAYEVVVAGTWTLVVYDAYAQDTGTLDTWSITV